MSMRSKRKEKDDDDLLEAKAYPYTHFDCPHCDEPGEAEGDVNGEVFKCENCNEEFVVKN